MPPVYVGVNCDVMIVWGGSHDAAFFCSAETPCLVCSPESRGAKASCVVLIDREAVIKKAKVMRNRG